MEKSPAFVVPAGVTFQINDDGVVIHNQGDIVLHTRFGRPLSSVVSAEGSVEIHTGATAGTISAREGVTVHGDLTAVEVHAGGAVHIAGNGDVGTIKGDSVKVGGNSKSAALHATNGVEIGGSATGTAIHSGDGIAITGDSQVDALHAQGTIRVGGALVATTLRGGDVRLEGASITAKGIQGTRSVTLGAGRVQIDAIIAPEVQVDARTAGKVTVVESHNELGPNGIKGRYSLADYAEMFGDPDTFLTQRGLNTLDGTPPPPAAAPAAAPPSPPPAQVQVSQPVASEPEPPARAESTPVQMEIDEDEDAAAEHDSTPATPMAPQVTTPEHPLHGQLMDAVTKILDCYGTAEVPPAVTHLRGLIEGHQYDQVRGEITTIWSDLLKFHQKKGMRIQHQVTTTFNTINSLVKKM